MLDGGESEAKRSSRIDAKDDIQAERAMIYCIDTLKPGRWAVPDRHPIFDSGKLVKMHLVSFSQQGAVKMPHGLRPNASIRTLLVQDDFLEMLPVKG